MEPIQIDELTYYKGKANRLATLLSQEIDHSTQLEIIIEELNNPSREEENVSQAPADS